MASNIIVSIAFDSLIDENISLCNLMRCLAFLSLRNIIGFVVFSFDKFKSSRTLQHNFTKYMVGSLNFITRFGNIQQNRIFRSTYCYTGTIRFNEYNLELCLATCGVTLFVLYKSNVCHNNNSIDISSLHHLFPLPLFPIIRHFSYHH